MYLLILKDMCGSTICRKTMWLSNRTFLSSLISPLLSPEGKGKEEKGINAIHKSYLE